MGLPVGGRSTSALVLVLVLAVIAAMAWLLLSALSARPAVSIAANAFATDAFAIHQFGYHAARVVWYDGGLAALQVAGYETLTGALRRSPTVVIAAREAIAVASVLTTVALAVAARRLRLSGPAVVAVALLYGLAPAALVLHHTADPAHLGILWACVALALVAGRTHAIGQAVAAGFLALAAATSPLVLIALVPLFATLVWSGPHGRFDRRARMAAAAVGIVLYGVLVALAVMGRLRGGAAVVPELGALDWALAVAAIAAGIGALWVGWLRPFAVALLATTLAAAVAPDLRGSLILVALPLAALVLPAAVEVAAVAFGRRHEPWLPGRVVIVGALAAATVLAWVPTAHTVRQPVDGSRQMAVSNAKAWVFTNLPTRPKLVVDDTMWACLVKSGYPSEQLVAASGVGPDRTSWRWVEAQYAIGRDETLVGAADPVGIAWAKSTPVASFGDGVDSVVVRRVVTEPGAAAASREEAQRVAAGRALAGNPRLDLEPKAADLVRTGSVDSRALTVLAAATAQHRLHIVDFPVVPGEEPVGLRRLIAVDAVDGQLVRPGVAPVTALEKWLTMRPAPYRPAAVELGQLEGDPVMIVRYDALGSTGLLAH